MKISVKQLVYDGRCRWASLAPHGGEERSTHDLVSNDSPFVKCGRDLHRGPLSSV